MTVTGHQLILPIQLYTGWCMLSDTLPIQLHRLVHTHWSVSQFDVQTITLHVNDNNYMYYM